MKENEIGTIIIKTAIEIHKALGPGLFEKVYEVVLSNALKKKGLKVKRQVAVEIKYDGITFDEGFRADLIVEDKVIIERKSKQELSKSDKKQIMTYIKLANMKLGYILNFAEAYIKDGIIRSVNGLEEEGYKKFKPSHYS